ncbi:MAG TPA: hypothetical protein VFV95_06490 [Vicinamibacterales bacterium]|nr:hypothetical protein [Vicinamibacterales bacterium]
MRMLLVLILLGGTSFALVSAQGNSRTVWSGTVGQRQVVIEERWTPPFTDNLVSVRVSASGKTSTIPISTAGRSPDMVVPWASDRLVVITAEMASIVDLVSELVVDQFFVARPSISPTGRFIAYRRFFQPPWSQDEDVLLVYDVGSSVPLNRLPSNARGMEAMRDVGLPVFPEWHRANRKYRGRNDTPGAPIETLRSAVVWATDSDFVFLGARGGAADPDAALAIHHVHVRGAGQPPVLRSQAIDASKLIDLAGYDNPRPASGAPLLYARDIKVMDCARSVCQAQIEWIPTQGLRAPSLDVTFSIDATAGGDRR